MRHLTLEEKVGQLFWFGLPGPALAPASEKLIHDGKVGGSIFFARQGSDPTTLKALTDQIQKTATQRSTATPGLIISVDQEGGHVQRWGEPFTPWPGNMAIGATGSEANAEEVAAAMAREIRAVGVNLNLSPVAEVNNNPANPVIGIRSFGENPQAVARLVAASIKGFQSQQVGAVAKHFPGHGDTDVDSHKALPLIRHSWERMEQVELVPFRSAIKAGVDAIMSAHILFPSVAADGLPATLSGKVLQETLKGKLGYTGVVVTDALDNMKAISANYGVENGLIMAIQAGADAVLITESYHLQDGFYNTVLRAVNDGKISSDRLNDAVRRTLTLKEKRGLLAPAQTSDDAVRSVGNEAHRRLAHRVGAQALTLVRNRDLPLKLRTDERVLVVGPSYSAKSTKGLTDIFTALGEGVRAQHANVEEITLERSPSKGSTAAARILAEKASVIVYGVYNAHKYPEHLALIREFVATGKPLIVVGMGEPYDLTALPEVRNYVAAYGYQSTNLLGVGAVLFGQSPPQGKLPVSIPGLYPIGHGLSY